MSGDELPSVGIDVGATLIKLARAREGGDPELLLLPADDLDGAREQLREWRPERVGITGGGSPLLIAALEAETRSVPEFTAWALGATVLLDRQGIDTKAAFVVASVGTGCSAICVDGEKVTRLGGTALGGGSIVGLGAALLGTADFGEIVALANRGDRRNIDLMVGDIAGGDAIDLPNELIASSFAKLARPGAPSPADRADLASAIMGLVGANIGWICAGLARIAGVRTIAFGGSTLRDNESCRSLIAGVSMASGLEPILLPDGEFTGAVGALAFANQAHATKK